jgi:C4-type Zn-finger protein
LIVLNQKVSWAQKSKEMELHLERSLASTAVEGVIRALEDEVDIKLWVTALDPIEAAVWNVLVKLTEEVYI